jgi:hypothetical protein
MAFSELEAGWGHVFPRVSFSEYARYTWDFRVLHQRDRRTLSESIILRIQRTGRRENELDAELLAKK